MDKDYSLLRPFDEEAAKNGEELWAPAIGEYFVSSLGRVKGPKGVMSPSKTQKGYLRVCLSVEGKQVEAKVHRLVASAYIPNAEGKPQVNHIDGDKTNNNVLNLEWCDNKHNQLHYRRVLKGGVVPLVATNDKETILFESGSYAKEAGHNTGEISRIINNHCRKHHGFNWYSKDVFEQKNGVLAWVDGKPVYKGDMLWHDAAGECVVCGPAITAYHDLLIRCKSLSSESEAQVSFLTWTPPKVKREGWVNLYPSRGGEVFVAGTSNVYATKESADLYATPNRINCLRIEWEE